MHIEIHQPELEALILERMQSGRFETIEAVLLSAMRSGDDSAPAAPVSRKSISEVFAAARGFAEDLDLTRDRTVSHGIDLS